MKITIDLPDDTIKKLKNEADEMGFNDVKEFIMYIITDFVGDIDYDATSSEKEIKDRLKALGYLD